VFVNAIRRFHKLAEGGDPGSHQTK
jgi:hypothetical protein